MKASKGSSVRHELSHHTKKSVVCKYILTSISQFVKTLQLVTSEKLQCYASVSILVIHYHSDCQCRTVVLSYLSNVLFQRSRIIQYCCNHIILRLKKKKKKKKSHHLWRKPVQMIRLATSTPGHVEVNRWSATVHSRAPELRLQQSLCFYFSSAGLTALPLRIVEEMP